MWLDNYCAFVFTHAHTKREQQENAVVQPEDAVHLADCAVLVLTDRALTLSHCPGCGLQAARIHPILWSQGPAAGPLLTHTVMLTGEE